MIQTIQEKFTKIILASQSPRRRALLSKLGLQFATVSLDIDEVFPAELNPMEVAPYLSDLKAKAYTELNENELLITCDTTVCINNRVVNKPLDNTDAFKMLKLLSGNQHTVVTGITLKSTHKTITFSELTRVYFDTISDQEIDFYIHQFEVMDKAGAYGIQDWIGYRGVNSIEGCYYNVMGLPTARLYNELLHW